MYDFFKRCFDLLFSVCFLAVFSPVYIISWLIIKIVSPGPAIYKAERVGKGGKLFKCYKFRSMRVDSGKVRLTTLGNDDRIFPFGKFIRKTKIDEMPQVVNILKGDMSVVGPRPEDKENADKVYVGEYVRILDVKPGNCYDGFTNLRTGSRPDILPRQGIMIHDIFVTIHLLL